MTAEREIAVRWESGRWVHRDPPRPAPGGMMLSAVDVDPAGHVWTVGQSVSESVVRTGLVLERRGGSWRRHRVPTGAGTGFTAVRALAADDVWVVGSAPNRYGLKPIVAHWKRRAPGRSGRSRRRALMPRWRASPEARGGNLWGGRLEPRPMAWTRPLVLHHKADGSARRRPAGVPGPVRALLADVSVDAQGRPWVVGAPDYRDTVDLWDVPVAAPPGRDHLDPSGRARPARAATWTR